MSYIEIEMAESTGLEHREPSSRTEEITDEIYRDFAEALPHLSKDLIAAANLMVLAKRYGEKQATLEKELKEAQQLSTIDKLTNLLNARGIDDALEREMGIFQRRSFQNGQSEQKPLMLLMIDGDKIKDINDKFGHSVGDKAIIEIANAMKASASRDKDSSGRSGGDEFKVILPETDLQGALHVAEEMRIGVIKAAEKDPRLSGLSICIGIAIYDGTETKEELVNRADHAMYRAKEQRNCIAIHPNDMPQDAKELSNLNEFVEGHNIRVNTNYTAPAATSVSL